MNQLCRVCGEPAAGFHFGAFTCEGCKSFFGRTYNNLSSISECKNGGQCVINKKNRTSCKACRLRKCLVVGMSKSGSRYGRRSNWFKIHCLLQEQSHNNNNNNNSIPSIQQTSNHHISQHSLDSKPHIKDTWGHKKPSESPPNPPRSSSASSSLIPDLRSLPDLRNYSGENAASLAAAAAAFWASRGNSLLPHLPSSDLALSSSPQLSPFLASPFANRNFLFPYLSPPATSKQERLSTPTTNSPPPSSSSSSSASSGCSSPNNVRIFEKETPTSPSLSGLALLRTLGPVQEKPMDLSVRAEVVKSEGGSDLEDARGGEGSIHSGKGGRDSEGGGGGGGDSDSGCKMERPPKPATPLDLTTKV